MPLNIREKLFVWWKDWTWGKKEAKEICGGCEQRWWMRDIFLKFTFFSVVFRHELWKMSRRFRVDILVHVWRTKRETVRRFPTNRNISRTFRRGGGDRVRSAHSLLHRFPCRHLKAAKHWVFGTFLLDFSGNHSWILVLKGAWCNLVQLDRNWTAAWALVEVMSATGRHSIVFHVIWVNWPFRLVTSTHTIRPVVNPWVWKPAPWQTRPVTVETHIYLHAQCADSTVCRLLGLVPWS